MSWSGTVRCSWCGEDGHNKRSCPARRAYIDSAADSGAEWAKQEQRQMNRRKAVHCGWCGGKGHNARSCEHKKQVITKLPAVETRCHKIIELLIGNQIGKGSTVKKTTKDEWHHPNYPERAVVLGFHTNLNLGGRLPSKKFLQDTRWTNRWLYWLAHTVSVKSLNDNGEQGWVSMPNISWMGVGKDAAHTVGHPKYRVQSCVLGGMPFDTNTVKVDKGVLPHQVDGFVEFLDGVIEKLGERKNKC